MSDFLWTSILNYSIWIPAILALIRFRSVISRFYPFLIVILLGALNEVLSVFYVFNAGSNAVSSNIYVLLEFFLILLQFYKWNKSACRKLLLLGVAGFSIWIADNLILHTLERNNSLFRVSYSFMIILISVDRISKIVIFEKAVLFKNAMFGLCFVFAFYFSCKAFVESFDMFAIGLSTELLQNLMKLMTFVNFISNLLYSLVILWIPKNRSYT